MKIISLRKNYSQNNQKKGFSGPEPIFTMICVTQIFLQEQENHSSEK